MSKNYSKLKRMALLAVMMCISICMLAGLNHQVSFTASGVATVLDKVEVQNLTNGQGVVVEGGGALLLTEATALFQLNADQRIQILNDRNTDEIRLSIFSEAPARSQITVVAVDGRAILNFSGMLDAGVSIFKLLLPKGVYVVSIRQNDNQFSSRVVGNANVAPRMFYEGLYGYTQSAKVASTSVPLLYQEGERLLFKGFSGNYVCIVTAIVSQNKVVNFDFVECKDADGNYYSTVKIGNQIWMAENLKTTKYNDGLPITLVTDKTAWGTSMSAAYCWYNNDMTRYKDLYGALYNWYTVITGKLAPTGWHVPTDEEWIVLENYLIENGYNYDGSVVENKVAKSLAGNSIWMNNTKDGTVGNDLKKNNSTGFGGMPGGNRSAGGNFYDVEGYGGWWNASSGGTLSDGWNRALYMNYNYLVRYTGSGRAGFSIRCVKD